MCAPPSANGCDEREQGKIKGEGLICPKVKWSENENNTYLCDCCAGYTEKIEVESVTIRGETLCGHEQAEGDSVDKAEASTHNQPKNSTKNAQD